MFSAALAELVLHLASLQHLWKASPFTATSIIRGYDRALAIKDCFAKSDGKANRLLRYRQLIERQSSAQPLQNFHSVTYCEATWVLARQQQRNDTPFPFTANGFGLAWERLRGRAGQTDLRCHDLRHEAISRFLEPGLDIPEVEVISGHKDPRRLFRYTHLRGEELLDKINANDNLDPMIY